MYIVQVEVVVEDRMEGVEEKVVVKAAVMSKHGATTERKKTSEASVHTVRSK